ncbi:MAG TPA: hypothetical protein VGV18_04320, partial [Verrucomicrobiae bacterium]|nr:hypothetical protein [Verrucomicrobiae bacterium]
MIPSALSRDFPQTYVPAAMMVSLLSVWMLVGLFFYLNRYTKREYFTIWTVAWLFYALWLTLSLKAIQTTGSLNAAGAGELPVSNFPAHISTFWQIIFILKQCCVAISAVFLLWGSLRF